MGHWHSRSPTWESLCSVIQGECFDMVKLLNKCAKYCTVHDCVNIMFMIHKEGPVCIAHQALILILRQAHWSLINLNSSPSFFICIDSMRFWISTFLGWLQEALTPARKSSLANQDSESESDKPDWTPLEKVLMECEQDKPITFRQLLRSRYTAQFVHNSQIIIYTDIISVYKSKILGNLVDPFHSQVQKVYSPNLPKRNSLKCGIENCYYNLVSSEY